MGKFKYQELLDTLNVPCPPTSYEERETIAFRWVFKPISENESFLPQYLKNKERHLEAESMTKCLAMGLSFFITEKTARAKYMHFTERSKKLAKSLGTHLASGIFQKEMGVNNLANEEGHFTFHPYK